MAQHLFLVTLFDGGYYEKQLIFIVLTIPLIFIVLSVDGKFYEKYANYIWNILLTLAGLLFENDCRTALLVCIGSLPYNHLNLRKQQHH
jgi:hypothetical protein